MAVTGSPSDSLDTKYNPLIRRARLALAWERALPKVAATAGVGVLFLGVSWLGLWAVLPPVAKMVGVASFAFAGAAAPFFVKSKKLIPSRSEAISRIDQNTGSPTRPMATMADKITSSDPQSAALWRLHIKRIEDKWGSRFKAGSPRSDLYKRDPYALRSLLVLLTVVSGAFAGPQRYDRVAEAFNWEAKVAKQAPQIEAWVNVPDYVRNRTPTIFLTRKDAVQAELPTSFEVPENSTLTVMSLGGVLKFGENAGMTIPEPHMMGTTARYEFKIATGRQCLNIPEGPSWCFDGIKDTPPIVDLRGIRVDPKQPGKLQITTTACDDYGVEGAEIVLEPTDKGRTDAKPLEAGRLHGVPLSSILLCPKAP